MTDKQKWVLLALIALGAAYFAVFIFPNATGARDLNMTYIFNSDEPAQYVHMVRMLTPANTLRQSLYRFLAYQHYFYGFPYYFYAAVFGLLPVRLYAGLGHVSLNMLMLRQIVSVLPMVVAVILLVYLQTRFRSMWQSLPLFAVLLLVPEVVENDLWLHPESLVFLLIVLTLFFLVQDDLRFGWRFYVAALCCGLAVATKLIGLFYFLAIPLYIYLGWQQKRIDMRRAVIIAGSFVGIMVVTFVLCNPFLFWQSERTLAWKTQTNLHAALGSGFIVAYHHSPAVWFSVISENYSVPAFLLLAVAAAITGAFRAEKRILSIMILAWAVPFMTYIAFALAIRAGHFPLPILLPVFSCIPSFFAVVQPAEFTKPLWASLKTSGWRLVLFAAGIAIIAWQLAFSLGIDIPAYWSTLNRQKDNPSIQYFQTLDQDYLSRLKVTRPLVVFRDVAIYIPNSARFDVHFQWGITGYPEIQKLDPDLLILSKQHLRDYTQPGQLGSAIDPNFSEAYRLYSDALAGQVPGFTVLYQNGFGTTLLRTTLYDQFFR